MNPSSLNTTTDNVLLQKSKGIFLFLDGIDLPLPGTQRHLNGNRACATLHVPGMFARVKLTGETIPNAILVPQRAVQQLLDKTFVMVVGADGKSESRSIELGQQIGSYYIVKSGLSANDTVVVEGLSSLTEGKDLAVTMVTPEEMGFSFDEDTTPFDTMTSSEANSGDSNS